MNPSTIEADASGHEIFSPEGVRLDLVTSGVPPRMLAYAIDFIVIGLLVILSLFVSIAAFHLGKFFERLVLAAFPAAAQSAKAAREGRGAPFTAPALGGAFSLLIVIFLLAQFVIESGYFIFWEMVSNGRSPGKALVGLRVIRRDGSPIDLRSSVIRNVLRIADNLPMYYCVGMISMVLSPSGERLGDHIAGTLVVRLDRPESAPEIEEVNGGSSLTLTRNQLSRIGPRELRLLRATLRRVSSLPEDRRVALLNEVSDAMRARLEIEPLPSQDAMSFLRALLSTAERYSRSK